MSRSSAPRATPRASGTLQVPVFTHILSRGAATRTEIGDVFGISAAAVTRLVRPLLADGLLREREASPSWAGIGRPAQVLEVVAERERFVGIKVNRNNVVAVSTDLRARLQESVTVPLSGTVRPGRPVPVEHVVSATAKAIASLSVRPTGVGIAVSGDVDRSSGLVRLSPLLDWKTVPLRDRLSEACGAPVVVDNDVRAVTTAERWFGAGADADPFAVITVGAGVGCGIVANGRIQRGAFGVAGELGHLCVELDGPPCRCGRHGCVEAIAATGPLLTAAGAAAGRRITSLAALLATMDAETGRARPVRRTADRAGRAVAVAVAAVVNLIGPQRILISTESFEPDALYGAQWQEQLRSGMFGQAAEVEIITRELPFTEWARGAAVTAIENSVSRHV